MKESDRLARGTARNGKAKKTAAIFETKPADEGRSNGRARARKKSGTEKMVRDSHGATMMNAVGATVPVTEWDCLSASSRDEVEHLVDVLKALKQGDFSVRLEFEKSGILGRAGELLNDNIGLNEH